MSFGPRWILAIKNVFCSHGKSDFQWSKGKQNEPLKKNGMIEVENIREKLHYPKPNAFTISMVHLGVEQVNQPVLL